MELLCFLDLEARASKERLFNGFLSDFGGVTGLREVYGIFSSWMVISKV